MFVFPLSVNKTPILNSSIYLLFWFFDFYSFDYFDFVSQRTSNFIQKEAYTNFGAQMGVLRFTVCVNSPTEEAAIPTILLFILPFASEVPFDHQKKVTLGMIGPECTEVM